MSFRRSLRRDNTLPASNSCCRIYWDCGTSDKRHDTSPSRILNSIILRRDRYALRPIIVFRCFCYEGASVSAETKKTKSNPKIRGPAWSPRFRKWRVSSLLATVCVQVCFTVFATVKAKYCFGCFRYQSCIFAGTTKRGENEIRDQRDVKDPGSDV